MHLTVLARLQRSAGGRIQLRLTATKSVGGLLTPTRRLHSKLGRRLGDEGTLDLRMHCQCSCETVSGASNEIVRDARLRAAREGCTRVSTRTPEGLGNEFRPDEREWILVALRVAQAAHEGSANSLRVKHPGRKAREELVREIEHEGRGTALAVLSKER